MTTTDPASASTVLHGTYSVGSDGVLTITIPGKAVEKEWKTTAALDSYQSFYLKSNVSTVTTRWFFDPSLGGAQAYAYAHGQTMPVSH
ncbi:MAG: hypothetical protein KGI91_16045 [Burkholderiales bacterium]|nr:hypothetical protein [Burkholderiales bacterium]